jgi:CubicO group peptidase (beta-lactamase class C family)
MKLKICSFILIQVFLQPLIFGQSLNKRIHQVENNLMPYAQVVGKEVQTFNIEDRMRFYHVPAISIAVINKGKIEWAKAYGFADSSTNEKATTETLFQAGSISKSLNATCIQILVRENKLILHSDFRTYLKTWKFPENEFSKDSKITIQNLLDHTAGLTVHGFNGYTKGQLYF